MIAVPECSGEAEPEKSEAKKNNLTEVQNVTAEGRVVKMTQREMRREFLLEDVILMFGGAASGKNTEKSELCAEGDDGVAAAGVEIGRVLIYLPVTFPAIEGDRIRVVGILQLFEHPTNPGQFDYAAYQASLGVNLLLNGSSGQIIVKGERPADGWLGSLRRYLADVLVRTGGESGGTMAALVLGDKTWLPDERYQLYLDSGIGHILTLSGLHLSLFGVGLYRVLRKRLTLPQWPAAVLMAIGICAYVSLIGGGISASRAAIALIVSLLGGCLGKTYDSLSAAALGMIMVLFEYPLQIARPSFWLSFGAVFAMGGFLPALSQWMKPKGMCGKWLKLLLPPLVIQLALMPVTAVNQYTLQTYSVLLNLIVVPMMGPLLGGSIAVLMVGMVHPQLAGLLAVPVNLAFNLIDRLCRFSLELLGSVVAVGRPSTGSLLIYGVILGGFIVYLYRRNRLDWEAMETAEYTEEPVGAETSGSENEGTVNGLRAVVPRTMAVQSRKSDLRNKSRRSGRKCGKRWAVLLITATVLSAVLALDLGGRQLSITFLDVGQGDCIVIETPNGTSIMVDGGSTSESRVGEYRIRPYLEWAGIDRLDYVIVTHLDEDHVNGVEELLEDGFPIGTVLISAATTDRGEVEELYTIVDKNRTEMVEISFGDRLLCGKVEIECVSPQREGIPASENEASVVLRLTYGDFSCLLTGDIEGKGEEILEEHLAVQSESSKSEVTLLKVAHHGSKYSTSESFLKLTDPVAAVISCGADNSYGHPHEELLGRLEDAGCDIYCTADCGAVLVKTDGKRWSIVGYRAD